MFSKLKKSLDSATIDTVCVRLNRTKTTHVRPSVCARLRSLNKEGQEEKRDIAVSQKLFFLRWPKFKYAASCLYSVFLWIPPVSYYYPKRYTVKSVRAVSLISEYTTAHMTKLGEIQKNTLCVRV